MGWSAHLQPRHRAGLLLPSNFGRQGERFARAELDDAAPRWTVDTPADFAFVQAAYEALYADNPRFGTQDILNWIRGQAGGVHPVPKAA